jgi:GAF domain-containing protein
VRQQHSRSLLCLPLVKQAMLTGVLYLENSLVPGVFTPKRLAMLELWPLRPQSRWITPDCMLS